MPEGDESEIKIQMKIDEMGPRENSDKRNWRIFVTQLEESEMGKTKTFKKRSKGFSKNA